VKKGEELVQHARNKEIRAWGNTERRRGYILAEVVSRSTPLPNGFIHDAHRAHHIIVLAMMDDDECSHVYNVSRT